MPAAAFLARAIGAGATASLAALNTGCGASGGTVLAPAANGAAAHSVADLKRSYPLPDNANILPTLLGRTEALSYHFIQIRDRERPHRHASHDLVVTLLSGEGSLHLDDRAFPMRAGDTAFVPRGQKHFFVNTGDGPAAAFVTFAPPYDGRDSIPAE